MAKRPPKGKGPSSRAKVKGKTRAPRLPGLEDTAIEPLEELAAAYARIRDRRMALNAEEVALKAQTLSAMERLGRTHYKRAGIEISVVAEEATVKVRVVEEKPE